VVGEARHRTVHAQELARAWGGYIASLGPWDVFGGLTYDLRRRERPVSPASALRDATRWLGRGQALLRRELTGVLAVEHHKNGTPHIHPLVRVRGGLRGDEFGQLGQLWFKQHGYAKLEEPRSHDDVCEYAAKYLSKDVSEGTIVLWPLRAGLDRIRVSPQDLKLRAQMPMPVLT
jgi:hypothetical protein